MRTVSASAHIPAPPAEVFAFLADLHNLARWMSGIVSAELTTPGAVGAGTRAHVVRELLGQRFEVDVVVAAYEPPKRVQLDTSASGIEVRATLDLEPAPGDGATATTLGLAMQIRARSIFMAPVEGMVAGAAEQDIAASLERIRASFAEPAR
jgi:uncharacterized protein YndB with AHSA1/START domain